MKRIDVECGKGDDNIAFCHRKPHHPLLHQRRRRGDDQISIATKGNSFISGGAGDDNLSGGTGNDSLEGDAGDDLIFGGKGNDTLSGGAGFDQIEGGQGNDSIQAQDGAMDHVINGGAGIDTAAVDSADIGNEPQSAFKLQNNSIEGPHHLTHIAASMLAVPQNLLTHPLSPAMIPTPIHMRRKRMSPSIEPLEHRRLYSISSKAGIMHINLGGGNDTVTLVEFGNSTRALYTAVIGTRTVETKSVDLSRITRINLQGGKGDDSIDLDIRNLKIRIFANGNEGNDHIIIADHGNCYMSGGAGNDILTAGVGNDIIDGNGGNDSLFGGKAATTPSPARRSSTRILGGHGNDLLLAHMHHGKDPIILVAAAGSDTGYIDRVLSTNDLGNITESQFKIDNSIETLFD